MDDRMSKAALLDTLRIERARWDMLIIQAGPDLMVKPGAVGDWSVKDVVAHMTAREMLAVKRLQADLQAETQPAAAVEACRNKSVRDVLADSQRVFQQLLVTIQTLTDEQLRSPYNTSPHSPSSAPGDPPLWKCIAEDSYEHYRTHYDTIREWLRAAGVLPRRRRSARSG